MDGTGESVIFSHKNSAFAYSLGGRDYGTTRGYPNESEFTYVKVRSLACIQIRPSNSNH